MGNTFNGLLDQANDITRNINAQTLLNVNTYALTSKISVSGLLGNAISDSKSTTDALLGRDFLDPNFVSINNTNLRQNKTTIAQRRLVSAFGSATFDYYAVPVLDGDGEERLDLDDSGGPELVFLSLDIVELHLLRRIPERRPRHDRKAPGRVR